MVWVASGAYFGMPTRLLSVANPGRPSEDIQCVPSTRTGSPTGIKPPGFIVDSRGRPSVPKPSP